MLGDNQLRKNRCRHHQASPIEGRLESRPHGQAESGIFVSQRVHNISINGGRHRPRNSRSQRAMLFLPDPISGLPIPRYFENVLWLRTGRTRIPFPRSQTTGSPPARTPKMRRSSRDTVIFHLLVIRACFCIQPCSLLSNIFLTRDRVALSDHNREWDSVGRCCALRVHKLACATGLHKREPRCPVPVSDQCRHWRLHWWQPGPGKGRIHNQHGRRLLTQGY